MVGQPPSSSEMEAKNSEDGLDEEEDFDVVLEKIYAGVKNIDPKDLIMGEQLSKKDQMLLEGM
jgi:hypothetical protein